MKPTTCFAAASLWLLSCHHPAPPAKPTPAPTTQAAVPASKPAEASWVLKIFARPITQAEVENSTDELFALLGLAVPETVLAYDALNYSTPEAEQNSTLAWLIYRELLLREAKAQGLSVSDDELQRELENPGLGYRMYASLYSPDFQEAFQKIVESDGWAYPEYLESVRRSLLVRKMLLRFLAQVEIPEAQLRALFVAQETSLAFEVIRVPFSPRAAALTVSKAEIKAYQDAHEAALTAQFEDSGAAASQVKSRHILIKFSGEDKASRASDLARITALQDRLKAGEDFSALAKEASEDSSAARGGDLGWANPAAYVVQFKEALEVLSVGEASGIVETQFGYHLILLEERKAAKTFAQEGPALAEAALRVEKASAAATKDATALLEKAKKTKASSLVKLLPKKYSPTLFVVESQSASLEEIAASRLLFGVVDPSARAKQLLSQASTQDPLVSELFQDDSACLVLRLTARTEADESLYAAKREELLASEQNFEGFSQLLGWLGAQLEVAARTLEFHPDLQ